MHASPDAPGSMPGLSASRAFVHGDFEQLLHLRVDRRSVASNYLEAVEQETQSRSLDSLLKPPVCLEGLFS